ncbi:MAG: chemotaxis protein CheA [Chitinivibrionales bacterium]|nr:chemotaxis protein CheA [Chitinivibrionales bacterium]
MSSRNARSDRPPYSNGLAEQIEHLAQTLVLAEVADPDALSELGTILNELAAASSRGRYAVIGKAAKAANSRVSAVAAAGGSIDELYDLLSRTVSAMQQLLTSGSRAAEVAFPEELGLKPAPAAASAKTAPPSSRRSPASSSAQTPARSEVLDDPVFFVGFVAEAREHLDTAEANLLTLEADPGDRESVDAVFRAFHTVKGVAAFLGLERIRELAHEAEGLLEKARREHSRLGDQDIALAFEATDALRGLVDQLASWLEQGGEMPIAEDGDLVERLRSAVGARDEGDTDEDTVVIAAARAPSAPEGCGEATSVRRVRVKETVRLDADRLDRLLETIGELVVTESMVSHAPALRTGAGDQLERDLNRLDKITKELQDLGTSLRMVPVRGTFQKMARLARDLSHRFGKEIEFVTAGDETELDRSMVDLLADPLVHMIRNIVDHAVETPRERRQAGKPPVARIELRAFHQGSSINIQVIDDGRGLDREVIVARACERGLIASGDALSEAEACSLIFRPGFSTAEAVTDVSGRGVGLDVVKKNVEALRGTVEVDSTPGAGTTFTIRLPLTLAIIDGLMLRVGTERYIIPTLNVLRAVQPGPRGIQTVVGKGEMLEHGGAHVPLFRLSRMFRGGGGEAERPVAILAEEEGRTVALLADELLGKQQYVIKNLCGGIGDSPGVAGCAILSDGSVGLILSVAGLTRMALEGSGLPGGDEQEAAV